MPAISDRSHPAVRFIDVPAATVAADAAMAPWLQ